MTTSTASAKADAARLKWAGITLLEWFMNYRNVPGYAWLLCSMWITDIMNHRSEHSLGWRPPLEVLTGQETIDISMILLCFLFWDVLSSNELVGGSNGSSNSIDASSLLLSPLDSHDKELSTIKRVTNDVDRNRELNHIQPIAILITK